MIEFVTHIPTTQLETKRSFQAELDKLFEH
jgi:hypothetical protein